MKKTYLSKLTHQLANVDSSHKNIGYTKN